MDPRWVAGLVFAMAVLLAGCASSGPAEPVGSTNFDFAYETVYTTGGREEVMRTTVRLEYDPDSGRVLSHWIGTEGDGSARRASHPGA